MRRPKNPLSVPWDWSGPGRSFDEGQKRALVDIAEGAPILRYGEVIGHAASPILAGEWVDEARIQMPDAPALDRLENPTPGPEPLPPLENYTFEGYRNADGSVGTKNLLG